MLAADPGSTKMPSSAASRRDVAIAAGAAVWGSRATAPDDRLVRQALATSAGLRRAPQGALVDGERLAHERADEVGELGRRDGSAHVDLGAIADAAHGGRPGA